MIVDLLFSFAQECICEGKEEQDGEHLLKSSYPKFRMCPAMFSPTDGNQWLFVGKGRKRVEVQCSTISHTLHFRESWGKVSQEQFGHLEKVLFLLTKKQGREMWWWSLRKWKSGYFPSSLRLFHWLCSYLLLPPHIHPACRLLMSVRSLSILFVSFSISNHFCMCSGRGAWESWSNIQTFPSNISSQ
jgi:hypothetical protein